MLLGEIAVVVVAGVGLLVAVRLLPVDQPRGRARAGSTAPARPDQLLQLERLVSVARSSSLEVHAHLRPVVSEIVSTRLAARGMALERLGEPAARELLGDRCWELVRPGRPFPEDRSAPGLSWEELGAMLDWLERL